MAEQNDRIISSLCGQIMPALIYFEESNEYK